MKNIVLLLGLIGLVSCSDNKILGENGAISNAIENATKPKLFIEGKWNTKGLHDYFPQANKDIPYYDINLKNDSVVVIKINAWQGGDKYTYTEKEGVIKSQTDKEVYVSINSPDSNDYLFVKTDYGIIYKSISPSNKLIIKSHPLEPFK